jgi:hypothetical protein
VKRLLAAAGLMSLLAAPAWTQIVPLAPDAAEPDVVLRRADWAGLEPLTLEDLLRRVPGVVLARSGGLGSLEFVQVLGSQNGRVQISLDGVEITSPELEWPRLQAMALGGLDRVEIFRTTDPARIALWTHTPERGAPSADLDLARGGVGTRTRRVQFYTPERTLSASVTYDEVLRDDEDFRAVPGFDAPPFFGAFTDRQLGVRIDLGRGTDHVQLSHWRQDSNTHGDLRADTDRVSTGANRTHLRWEHPVGAARLLVDVGHHSWDEPREIAAVDRSVRSGRSDAGLDFGWSHPDAWSLWLRTRVTEASADGISLARPVATRVRRQQAEAEIGRGGPWRFSITAGAHHDGRTAVDWSATARTAVDIGAWTLAASGGREIQFGGLVSPVAIRRGEHAQVELRRHSHDMDWRLQGFAKRLQDRDAGAVAVFTATGKGPQQLAGGLTELGVHTDGSRWFGGVGVGGDWIPHVTGDRAGLPELQGRLQAHAGRHLFENDLIVRLDTAWRFDADRIFGATARLPRAIDGDVIADAQLLQQAHVFLAVQNVADAHLESFPGVLWPGRTFLLGVRWRMID